MRSWRVLRRRGLAPCKTDRLCPGSAGRCLAPCKKGPAILIRPVPFLLPDPSSDEEEEDG